MADRFLSFVMSYAEHFISYRRDVSEKARQYASGLMHAGARKNIYAISEVVPDTDERNLQQSITHSKWSAREVIDHVARDADELIGDTSAALIIDESGFAKQGKIVAGMQKNLQEPDDAGLMDLYPCACALMAGETAPISQGPSAPREQNFLLCKVALRQFSN